MWEERSWPRKVKCIKDADAVCLFGGVGCGRLPLTGWPVWLSAHTKTVFWGPENENFWNWVQECKFFEVAVLTSYAHSLWKWWCLSPTSSLYTQAYGVLLWCFIAKLHHQLLARHAYYSVFHLFCRSVKAIFFHTKWKDFYIFNGSVLVNTWPQFPFLEQKTVARSCN